MYNGPNLRRGSQTSPYAVMPQHHVMPLAGAPITSLRQCDAVILASSLPPKSWDFQDRLRSKSQLKWRLRYSRNRAVLGIRQKHIGHWIVENKAADWGSHSDRPLSPTDPCTINTQLSKPCYSAASSSSAPPFLAHSTVVAPLIG